MSEWVSEILNVSYLHYPKICGWHNLITYCIHIIHLNEWSWVPDELKSTRKRWWSKICGCLLIGCFLYTCKLQLFITLWALILIYFIFFSMVFLIFIIVIDALLLYLWIVVDAVASSEFSFLALFLFFLFLNDTLISHRFICTKWIFFGSGLIFFLTLNTSIAQQKSHTMPYVHEKIWVCWCHLYFIRLSTVKFEWVWMNLYSRLVRRFISKVCVCVCVARAV